MGVRYHISPRTGNPSICRARGKCPFGDMQSDHFDSREAAREAYEERMKNRTQLSFAPGRMKVESLPQGMKIDPITFNIPKGVYLLGDPYYTAGQDTKAWQEWNAEANKTPRDPAVGATINGFPVIAFKAPAGEGIYRDHQARPYNSKSGYIGLVPVSLAKRMGQDGNEVLDDASLFTLHEDTEVTLTTGIICFGDTLFVQIEPDFDEVPEDEDEDDNPFADFDGDKDIYYARELDLESYARELERTKGVEAADKFRASLYT